MCNFFNCETMSIGFLMKTAADQVSCVKRSSYSSGK